jgi:hypothetical protein
MFAVSPASAASSLTRTAAAAPDDRPLELASPASFSFTIDALSPQSQADTNTVDFSAPYFFYLLTNTGTDADDYRLIVDNLSDPVNFFGQVCIGTVCFPDSAVHSMSPGQSDSVGVQVVAFADGMCTADFHVYSVGEPANQAHYTVTIWGGNAAIGVDVLEQGAEGYQLEQNTPNPVRSGTHIAFTLPAAERVSLDVFDVTGRNVRNLEHGSLAAGRHVLEWDGRSDDGRDLSSGVYFYKLTTSKGTLSKSLTLVR